MKGGCVDILTFWIRQTSSRPGASGTLPSVAPPQPLDQICRRERSLWSRTWTNTDPLHMPFSLAGVQGRAAVRFTEWWSFYWCLDSSVALWRELWLQVGWRSTTWEERKRPSLRTRSVACSSSSSLPAGLAGFAVRGLLRSNYIIATLKGDLLHAASKVGTHPVWYPLPPP